MRNSGWALSLVFAVAAMGSDPDREIVVHVHNNAQVPQSELRRAEITTGWMFKKAGIHVNWVECAAALLACSELDDPRLFVLSINRENPPERTDGVLGFALLQGRGNHAAAVYPRIAEKAEKDPAYRDCVLLASVMAHELGHLLFRSGAHGDGIMRTNWNRQDYKAMRQRQMVFTPEQASILREALTARVHGWPRTAPVEVVALASR